MNKFLCDNFETFPFLLLILSQCINRQFSSVLSIIRVRYVDIQPSNHHSFIMSIIPMPPSRYFHPPLPTTIPPGSKAMSMQPSQPGQHTNSNGNVSAHLSVGAALPGASYGGEVQLLATEGMEISDCEWLTTIFSCEEESIPWVRGNHGGLMMMQQQHHHHHQQLPHPSVISTTTISTATTVSAVVPNPPPAQTFPLNSPLLPNMDLPNITTTLHAMTNTTTTTEAPASSNTIRLPLPLLLQESSNSHCSVTSDSSTTSTDSTHTSSDGQDDTRFSKFDTIQIGIPQVYD